MDRLLYIAMSGAKQTMRAQAVNANNLANVNTTGFRADLVAMQQAPVYGPGYSSRVYGQAAHTGADLAPGTNVHTGRDLDVAVAGRGWIAVQARDGREAYTRAGNLKISQTGQLTTGTGQPVMGNTGPIAVPPAEKVEIGEDGTISIRPLGQPASTLAVVDRIKLVNPEPSQLRKNEQGLFQLVDGTVSPPDASARVVPGELETSNVSPVEAMVNMIDLARQFEMQVKMMKAAQENDSAASQMLNVS